MMSIVFVPVALLWTAPELLSPQTSGMTKAADMYSLSIVMYEVVFRKEPYDMSKLSPQGKRHLASIQGHHPNFLQKFLKFLGTDSCIKCVSHIKA